MKDKTIHYTVAFAVIFVFLLGVNQFVHTREKKALRTRINHPLILDHKFQGAQSLAPISK